MEYFFDRLADIEKKMQENKSCIFMFDFDGTLSEIAETPDKACLEKSIKDLLEKLSKSFFVAIISGRTLLDVKSKVDLPKLIYAGSHGLEWQIKNENKIAKINGKIKENLPVVKKEFEELVLNYKGTFIEEKPFGFSVHYRILKEEGAGNFLEDAEKIISNIEKNGLFMAVVSEKAIEVRPNIKWDKGEFAKYLLEYLGKEKNKAFLPVYVGNGKTDEDAFKVLRNGITVRIGESDESLANYFIKTGEINKFLLWTLTYD